MLDGVLTTPLIVPVKWLIFNKVTDTWHISFTKQSKWNAPPWLLWLKFVTCFRWKYSSQIRNIKGFIFRYSSKIIYGLSDLVPLSSFQNIKNLRPANLPKITLSQRCFFEFFNKTNGPTLRHTRSVGFKILVYSRGWNNVNIMLFELWSVK